MQLRSGRSIIASQTGINMPPPAPKLATKLSDKPTETKPTPSLTLLANVAIVRSIFTLLDKYNNLIKDNDANYIQLCEIVPNDDEREHRIKNLENTWFLDNARIRSEMVSIVNENFDIISEVVPPFMLYGIIIDARNIYDKFNAYKNEYPMIAKHYKMKNSAHHVDRILNVLLDEIDTFDDQYTEFIVHPAAQSRLYAF